MTGSSRDHAPSSGSALEVADPRAVWLAEPDEKLWTDEATGYLCLASRGPVGAWCGYVCVPEGHPAHGFPYNVYSVEFDELAAWTPARIAVQHRVNELRAHGGLTYSGGDRLANGEPVKGWWFGFDCAHAGDYSPRAARLDHPALGLGRPTGWGGVITYRDLGYAVAGCTSLAQQLAAIADEAPLSSAKPALGEGSRDEPIPPIAAATGEAP